MTDKGRTGRHCCVPENVIRMLMRVDHVAYRLVRDVADGENQTLPDANAASCINNCDSIASNYDADIGGVPSIVRCWHRDQTEMYIVAIGNFLDRERIVRGVCGIRRTVTEHQERNEKSLQDRKGYPRKWRRPTGSRHAKPHQSNGSNERFLDPVTCRRCGSAYCYRWFRLRRMFAGGRASIRAATLPMPVRVQTGLSGLPEHVAENRSSQRLSAFGGHYFVAHREREQSGRKKCGMLRREFGWRQVHFYRPN